MPQENPATPLLQLLDLDARGDGVFTGPPAPEQTTRVFGGQVLAQALAAACFTVQPDWSCHSLHAYFLRPGKPGRPIDYEVSAMRDGQRFVARKVIAVQRDEVNLELIASFTQPGTGREQQLPMPEAPAPESFPPEAERLSRLQERATQAQRQQLRRPMPLEFIRVDAHDLQDRRPSGGPTRVWVRTRGALQDDPNLHRCALAFGSDMGALDPCMRAIGARFGDPDLEVASLDHALWFHRPFRCDQWLLLTFESVSVAQERGFVRGTVHSRDGALVASIAQEGLLRARDESSAR